MITPEQPIQRRKLSHEILDRLLQLIEAEKLSPGDPLPSERELMTAFGVGRPAVREAMQSLERMGIIRISHGERARIAEPTIGHILDQISQTARHILGISPAGLQHLKEARLMFELQVVRQAVKKCRDADVERLEKIVALQESSRGSPVDFMAADGAFHREIAVISGNPIYAAVSEAMFGWLARFHVSLVRTPGLEDLTIAEHREVLDAFRARDVPAAANAMERHLTRANKLYRQYEETERSGAGKD